MAKKPKTERTEAEVERRLKKMFPSNLHKELWIEQDLEEEANDADKSGTKKGRPKKKARSRHQKLEDTLYHWWWEFQKAAQDFSMIRDEIINKGDEYGRRVMETDVLFGDLKKDFYEWWNDGGAFKFSEDRIPYLRALAPIDPKDDKTRDTLFLVIPLTISRELILAQVNVALDVFHDGKALRRHEHSTAGIKLFPKERYRDAPYQLMLDIWKIQQKSIKETNKKKSGWKAYCDAVPNSAIARTLLSGDDVADLRADYSKRADDLFKQAEALMRNAIQGQFPNDSKFQESRRKKSKAKGLKIPQQK